MQKDNTKQYWLVSGLYTIFEKGGTQLFGFGSLFMLIRTLDEDDWGLWALFLVVSALLEVTRMGLIQNALVKFLSAEKVTEHGKINTASFLLNISLTVLFSLFLFASAPFFGQLWDESIIPLLHIYALTTLVLTPMYQSNFILQANLSFKGIFQSNMIRQGSFFFFVLYLWVLDKPIILSEMAQFQVFAASLGSVIAVYHAWPFFNFSKKIDWGWIKKLIDFGKYAVSTNLSVILYKNMDKMMLGGMISTASVAIYDLAIRITSLMDIPISSAAAIVFPQSTREMVTKGKNGVKKMYEQSVGAILALLIPIILFIEIFPEFIILIIAGETYLSAVPLLRITILFGLFLPFGSQMGTVLESIGKPNINFYCTLLGFVLNIILNFLFISWLGVKGAAYGTLTTYMITFVVTQIILYKILKVNTLNVFKYMWEFYQKGFELLKEKLLEYREKSAANPLV